MYMLTKVNLVCGCCWSDSLVTAYLYFKESSSFDLQNFLYTDTKIMVIKTTSSWVILLVMGQVLKRQAQSHACKRKVKI